MLDTYCAWKMTYAIRNGACNALHPVEHRLCRWLLTCADVLEKNEIRLPQEQPVHRRHGKQHGRSSIRDHGRKRGADKI